MSNDTCINPLEEQRKQALQHYFEASNAIHHWSSFVEAAIKAYKVEPSPEQDELKYLRAEYETNQDKVYTKAEYDELAAEIQRLKWEIALLELQKRII